MRIICIDPGEKNIGIALSDPTGTIANPLTVLHHTARAEDAQQICKLAEENLVGKIVIGQSLDDAGNPTYEGRKAARLAAAVAKQTNIPVECWDESGSTQAARNARIAMNTTRKKRRGHIDELAAVVILQSYLDAHREDIFSE